MVERKNVVFVGFIFALFVVSLIFLLLKLGALSFGEWKEYKILFENVKGLPIKAEVRIAGVKVGYVDDISLSYEREKVFALVKIKVRKKFLVRRDFEAQIRAKSLLGEKYIELVPTGEGDTSPAPEGFLITRTSVLFEPDEFLMTMRDFIEVIDPKALKEFSQSTLELLELFKPTVKELNKMVSWMTRTLPEFEKMTRDLHEFIRKISFAFDFLDAKKTDIDKMLTKAPLLLDNANQTFQNINLFLNSFFSDARGEKIDYLLGTMPTAVSETVLLLKSMNDLTPKLSVLLDELNVTLKELRKMAREGVKVKLF